MRLSRPVVVSAASTVLVLGAGGALTTIGPWYRGLRKPSWQPPDWLFGPAWSAIGVLVAWSGVEAWRRAGDGRQRKLVIGLFGANAILNIAWSALFFTAKRPDWALREVVGLWVSIAALMVGFLAFAPFASVLLVPYLLWVSFASVLNRTVVRLNRPFGRAGVS